MKSFENYLENIQSTKIKGPQKIQYEVKSLFHRLQIGNPTINLRPLGNQLTAVEVGDWRFKIVIRPMNTEDSPWNIQAKQRIQQDGYVVEAHGTQYYKGNDFNSVLGHVIKAWIDGIIPPQYKV